MSVPVPTKGRAAKEGEDQGSDENMPDFADMRKWFVDRRRNENGIADFATLKQAIEQRERMPHGHVGARPSGIQRNIPESSWTFLGPTNFTGPQAQFFGSGTVNGRINAIAYDPTTENTVYIASGEGGVWKTTDLGQTWAPLSDSWAHMQVSALAVDPNNPQVIWAGTGDYPAAFSSGTGNGYGYGIGIMKSTDGGFSWDSAVSASSAAAFQNLAVSSIVIDPDNSNIAMVTTGRGLNTNGNVYRTTDGGYNWNSVGLPGSQWTQITVGPKDASGFRNFIVCAGKPNVVAYYSRDEGASWQALPLPPISLPDSNGSILVTCSPVTADTAYMMVNDNGGGSIWKTLNRGGTWFNITGNYEMGNGTPKVALYNWSQSFYNFFLSCGKYYNATAGAYQDLLVAGNVDAQLSLDLNGSWASLGGPSFSTSSLIHNDQHAVAFCPTNSHHFAIGNDGGLFLIDLDLASSSFTVYPENAHLGITQIFDLAVHPTMPWRVMTGTQDNGTPATDFSGTSDAAFSNWSHTPSGGDGTSVAYDDSDPSFMYCTNAHLAVWESRDGGATWANITVSQTVGTNVITWNGQPTAWVAPIAVDGRNGYLFAGTDHIWRYNISTKTWLQTSGQIPVTSGQQISTIAITADGTTMYVGTTDGYVFVSYDNGFTFRSVTGNLPWAGGRNVTSIAIDPTNINNIVVSSGALGSKNVWICQDTSVSTPSWTDANGSGFSALPTAPVNTIVRDFDMPAGTWYVGTDIGVFMTTDSGMDWANITGPLGLPNVMVSKLVANKSSRYIYAGTYGRGIWRIYDRAAGITLGVSSNPVASGNSATVTIAFDRVAPPGGYPVQVSTSDPAATPLPSGGLVVVPAGSFSTSFNILVPAGTSPETVTLTATLGGSVGTCGLSIIKPAISAMSFSKNPAYGGSDQPNLNFTLSQAAPPAGTTINFQSQFPSCASVPSSVTVGSGGTSGSIPITTFPVTVALDVTITASFTGGSKSETLHLLPNHPQLISTSNDSPLGGIDNPTAVLGLEYFAAANVGFDVSLSSSSSALTLDSGTIHVSPGAMAATFALHTKAVSSDTGVTLSASANGTTVTHFVTVLSFKPVSVTLSSSFAYGGSGNPTGAVSISHAAGSGGAVIALSSSDTAAAVVPSTITVPAGSTNAAFSVTTKVVSVLKTVTIRAALNTFSVESGLTVKPITLAALLLSSSTVIGSQSVTGTVALQYYAPAAGESVPITVSDSTVVSLSANPVAVPAGAKSATFTVHTQPVPAAKTVTFSATLNGSTTGTHLTLEPASLKSLTLTPASICGGNLVKGVVNLNTSTGSFTVSVGLKSSDIAHATVPASVTIARGAYNGIFYVTTKGVASTVTVSITATLASLSMSARLSIQPSKLTALSLTPTSVGGGAAVAGTVNLSGLADPAGSTVALHSANTAAASVPASVTVASTASIGHFTVTTHPVSASTSATISASYGGLIKSALLSIHPAFLSKILLAVSTLKGGTLTSGTVYLDGVTLANLSISLKSSDAHVVVPASVTVGAGASRVSFGVQTKAVTANTVVTVTATQGSASKSASVTLTP